MSLEEELVRFPDELLQKIHAALSLPIIERAATSAMVDSICVEVVTQSKRMKFREMARRQQTHVDPYTMPPLSIEECKSDEGEGIEVTDPWRKHEREYPIVNNGPLLSFEECKESDEEVGVEVVDSGVEPGPTELELLSWKDSKASQIGKVPDMVHFTREEMLDLLNGVAQIARENALSSQNHRESMENQLSTMSRPNLEQLLICLGLPLHGSPEDLVNRLASQLRGTLFRGIAHTKNEMKQSTISLSMNDLQQLVKDVAQRSVKNVARGGKGLNLRVHSERWK